MRIRFVRCESNFADNPAEWEPDFPLPIKYGRGTLRNYGFKERTLVYSAPSQSKEE